MNVLVCGGAGSISSHVVKWSASRGFTLTVLDNFSTAHRDALHRVALIEADLLDPTIRERAFARRSIIENAWCWHTRSCF